MEFFGEENYLKKMETIVIPFLRLNLQEGYLQGCDDCEIKYGYLKNPMERASIVISHGFCEFMHKYHELMYYMYQMGYSVFYIEHRGHGDSGRMLEDKDKVYVESYNQYVEDLKRYIDEVVEPVSSTKRLYLFAHSMGGAIGARFLELYPDIFKKAILSSPMIRMNYGRLSTWQVKLILAVASLLKWDEKYFVGQHGFDNVYVQETSSSQSKARYDYFFNARLENEQYRTYGGTYAWLRASVDVSSQIIKDAKKIKIPMQVYQAGLDTLVQAKAQNTFVKKNGSAVLKVFEDSKHEIFNAKDETRWKYLESVFDFLET